MIAPALNVERSKIKCTRAGRAEEKISKAASEFRIHFLRVVGGEIFQNGIGPDFFERGRIEESFVEIEFVPHWVAIVVEKLDVIIDEGMTKTISRGRKLICDSGVHICVIAGI